MNRISPVAPSINVTAFHGRAPARSWIGLRSMLRWFKKPQRSVPQRDTSRAGCPQPRRVKDVSEENPKHFRPKPSAALSSREGLRSRHWPPITDGSVCLCRIPTGSLKQQRLFWNGKPGPAAAAARVLDALAPYQHRRSCKRLLHSSRPCKSVPA
jgi:hypothetical protein